MINIDSHGLTCPEDSDYAALALYMQCTAELIDTTLAEQETSLNLINERPVIILTPSVAQVSSNTYTLYDTVAFNNSTFMDIVTGFTSADLTFLNGNAIAVGSRTGAPVTVPYLKGLYEFGIYAEGTATALVLNTGAFAEMNVFGPDGESVFPGATVNDRAKRFHTQEDSAGVLRANGKATVILDGTSGVTVTGRIFKSGATATWATVSFMWVRYLGPNEVIEVS